MDLKQYTRHCSKVSLISTSYSQMIWLNELTEIRRIWNLPKELNQWQLMPGTDTLFDLFNWYNLTIHTSDQNNNTSCIVEISLWLTDSQHHSLHESKETCTPHLPSFPWIEFRSHIQVEIQSSFTRIPPRIEVNYVLDPLPTPINNPIMPIERWSIA